MEEFGLYFRLGWEHILDLEGYDHILFVMALCAIYLLEDWKKVLVLVTAFTIGHSVTLALSVMHLIRVPAPLIEFLIPVTICITALANIIFKQQGTRTLPLNYSLALFFGLIHGLGFSNYLKSLLGSEANIVKPLLAFNLGLEFGQIVIVMGVLLIAALVVSLLKAARRKWTVGLSAVVLLIALKMVAERIPF